MIETLAASVQFSNGENYKELSTYVNAIKICSQHRALIRGYALAFIKNRKIETALRFIDEQLRIIQNDP